MIEYCRIFSNENENEKSIKVCVPKIGIHNRRMNPEEILRLISEDGKGFFSEMRFDDALYQIDKYEINPTKRTLTIYTKPIK